MNNVWSLVKKEVRAYFGSPIADAVMFSFILLVGYFFYSLVMWFNAQAMQMAQNPYYAQQVNINDMVFSPLFWRWLERHGSACGELQRRERGQHARFVERR